MVAAFSLLLPSRLSLWSDWYQSKSPHLFGTEKHWVLSPKGDPEARSMHKDKRSKGARERKDSSQHATYFSPKEYFMDYGSRATTNNAL